MKLVKRTVVSVTLFEVIAGSCAGINYKINDYSLKNIEYKFCKEDSCKEANYIVERSKDHWWAYFSVKAAEEYLE